MAAPTQNRIAQLTLTTLFLCVVIATAPPCRAQSRTIISNLVSSAPPHAVTIQSPASGALSGRLTDLHSAPLSGVSLLLRNKSTGAEVRATTANNGSFRFAVLDSGEYALEAESDSLGRSHLESILVTGGAESRLQAALRFEPASPTLIASVPPAKTPSPAANAPAHIAANAATSSVQLSAPPVLPVVSFSTYRSTTERANLETESLRIESALALASTHALPLQENLSAAPNLNAAAVTAVKSVAAFDSLSSVSIAALHPDLLVPVVANSISSAQIQALPSSGRHWEEFLLDTSPNSSQSAPGDIGQQSAQVTIDGAGTQFAFGDTAGSPSAASDPSSTDHDPQSSREHGLTTQRGLSVSEGAVRGVESSAGNVGVDAMRSPTGRTSVRTESGGNAFHGQGSFYDRQNTWGARNPFTQWVQNAGTASAPNFVAEPFTPPDHETVWGFGAGGRIRRDKLFWFAALDSNGRNDPGVAMVKNPTEFFNLPEPTSTDILLLSAQLGEGQSQAYNDYLGVANPGYPAAGLEQLAGLLGPAPRTSTQWTGFGRIDWQATERQRITLELNSSDSTSQGGGTSRTAAAYGNHSFGSSQSSNQLLQLRWEAFLSPNLLAATQASVGRSILSARPETPSAFEQAFLAGNFWGQLPQIVVDSRYGFTIGNPSRFGQGSYPDEKLYHAQQMLDWVRGKLLLKAGFEFDHNADATGMLRNQTGTYHYATVASFIADALAFQRFGFADALDPRNPHNCGTTNAKFGSQPCYSWYSQAMGPTDWHMSTNDWAGYFTAQWQLSKLAVISAGLRWEREQLPPPIAALSNPALPLTQNLPSLGDNWGPRVSLAVGKARSHWPVLRLGYGLYYGRVPNATIETALTRTGSLRGDLNFFMRPSDDCQFCSGGAPPFPYVFAGQPASVVKPGAVEFATNFRNPEIHQALASIEQELPGHTQLTASAMLSLGRRLPVAVATNFDPTVNPGTITYSIKDPTGKGPIKSSQITVPFYASWPSAYAQPGAAGRLNPNYQQITEIESRANSTYEAAVVRISHQSRRGLGVNARYTYAHATDWNPDESASVSGSELLDPANFSQEYGVSNLDMRHSAAATVIYEAPWKLRNFAGRLANGWTVSGIAQFRSGLPYTMRTTGSIPEIFSSVGEAIAGLGPSMNGSGGDNRVYGVGRNTFRYPITWKADLHLDRRFNLGKTRQFELLAETFNLFNHRNVTALETTGYSIVSGGTSGTLPTLCYLTLNTLGNATCGSATTLTGTGTPLPAFGQPLGINTTNFFRERQIQLGMRMKF